MKDLGSQAKGKPVFPGCRFKEYRGSAFSKKPDQGAHCKCYPKAEKYDCFFKAFG